MIKSVFKAVLTVYALMITANSFPCTTIIISGKATKDGRPLMWKNSDTENPFHSLVYSDSSGFQRLGIVRNSSKDINTASVWAGTNSQGFAIINTLSYNLTESRVSSNNGSLMRKALEICRNVPDFKHLLDTLSRPLNVEANYGVIDAEGNAAYFETSSEGYRMLDVNDPSVAPNGYLVYTNFSYTGFYDKGEGYIRYQTAMNIVAGQAPSKDFSPQWIFNRLARTYYNSLLNIDYTDKDVMSLYKNGYIPDSDFIPRNSTASSTVFHGVKEGENPELTTMWVILGYPPVSVALPAWVKAGNDNPALLLRKKGESSSKMCDWTAKIKKTLYDVERGHGQTYLHFSKVYNDEGTGYMQLLKPVEKDVFDTFNPLIEKWRETGSVNKNEIISAGKKVCDTIEKFYLSQNIR
ncbi:MAG: C45 family peptidase [Tannerella sp.]|jgi:hypothetical protein|nr:C45 family peptidase [Tannerella sp.]